MKLIKLFLIISLILNVNYTYAFDFKKFNPFKKKQPEQKAKMVEERALDIVEHYKDQMEPELYKGTKEEVVKESKAKKEKIAKEKKETNAK